MLSAPGTLPVAVDLGRLAHVDDDGLARVEQRLRVFGVDPSTPSAIVGHAFDAGGLGRGGGDALLLEQALQLAGLEHLADDVGAADELALHVELRDGRPVRSRP